MKQLLITRDPRHSEKKSRALSLRRPQFFAVSLSLSLLAGEGGEAERKQVEAGEG
jgi:hypothetical protein